MIHNRGLGKGINIVGRWRWWCCLERDIIPEATLRAEIIQICCACAFCFSLIKCGVSGGRLRFNERFFDLDKSSPRAKINVSMTHN